MSTRLFLRNENASVSSGYTVSKVLSTQQGFARVTSDQNNTTTGPVGGVQVSTDGGAVAWISSPLQAGSISGDITTNLWGYESHANANVGFQVRIELITGAGGSVLTSSEGIELAVEGLGDTHSSVHNWTDTPSPISITAGNRIRVTVYGDDAGGTMANGYDFHLTFGASAGNDGDSWVEFSDDISFQVYPTPSQDGPQYLKYLKRKKDYGEITVKSVFEDGGVDTLEHAADAPQRYEFLYDGLSDQEADVLDVFWDAHRLSLPFTLIEPRNEPWTGVGSSVEVQFESYEGDHTHVRSQSRKVVLIKYPA